MLSKYPSTRWLDGLPWWLSGEEYSCNTGAAGDSGLILGLGRSPGGGHSNPLQYSCLENPMDRGAPAGCSSEGRKESDTTEVTLHTCLAGWIFF